MTDPKMMAIAARQDIFYVEKDRRILVLIGCSIVVGMLMGFLMQTLEKIEVVSDFYEKLDPVLTAKLVLDTPNLKKEEEKKEEVKKKVETKEDRMKQKVLKIQQSLGAGGGAGGGSGGGKGVGFGKGSGWGAGDIRERVTQKGLLAIVSGKARGTSTLASSSSFLSTSGTVRDLDAVLSNIGGLKTSGRGGVGRLGIIGDKFNIGYGGGGGGGGGGGSGGIDDLLAGLGGSSATVAGLTKRANVELPSSKDIW